MFDSPWLDVAIGVALVWFLFALGVTLVNEAISKVFALRSKQLWKALSQMLDGDDSPHGLIHNALTLFKWGEKPKSTTAGDLAATRGVSRRLYATKAVQALENRSKESQKTRIRTLPAPVFTQALFELGRGIDTAANVPTWIAALPDKPIKHQLQALWDSAGGEVKEFRAQVDRWFDAQMARLSEIYKSQVRVILVPIGILIAVAGFGFGMRSDALELVNNLQHDATYRSIVVATADSVTKQNLAAVGCKASTLAKNDPKKNVECEIKGAVRTKNIGLILRSDSPNVHASFWNRVFFLNPFLNPIAALGVLITGIAISFGSTFWFDLLRRLVGMRQGSAR